ncbi:MAG: acetyl-CoA carboxylase carboxyl transferase subunit beta [Armatimonadetes bacterium]|nr:acetyl-CoA carboxylase carboxyl transferase subunit beta [Armatimonadota bacterium]
MPKPELPADDNWVQCGKCRKILFRPDFLRALKVCTACGHHHRLSARERIEMLTDPATFEERDVQVVSADPLEFPEYADKLAKSFTGSGEMEAILTGKAVIEDRPAVIGAMDFGFMGGSMGSAVGEKIARCFEAGIEERLPVVIACSSGGARMQEGLISLMQMAKTTAAVSAFRRSGLPYIAVFTDPTMAGVLASFASLADVIVAEPGALVGFAGQRVAQQAQVIKAPGNFQTAEFQHEHGMIDLIVHRRELKSTVGRLLDYLTQAA